MKPSNAYVRGDEIDFEKVLEDLERTLSSDLVNAVEIDDLTQEQAKKIAEYLELPNQKTSFFVDVSEQMRPTSISYKLRIEAGE